MRILVLGAGVIGLTTAIHLRRQGYAVDLWAKAISPGTTSDVAAAFWYPYAAFPVESVARWAQESFANFADLAKNPQTGVSTLSVSKFFTDEVDAPKWRDAVQDYEEFVTEEYSDYRVGFKFKTWLVDMTRYMPYLKSTWQELGGRVSFKPLDSFDDIPPEYDLIINCTGLGARELAQDHAVIAARGRVVLMAPFKNQPRDILLDAGDETFAMIVPRDKDIVLGGTYEENEEDKTSDDQAVQAIIARCSKLCPALASKSRVVLGSACGLRPVRSAVRLQLEKRADKCTVIHNYGHGGAGVTLAWGCAQDVAELVKKC